MTSFTIDNDIIDNVLGNTGGEYTNTLDLSFRHGIPGEIETSANHGEECQYGTYTFLWNSTEGLQGMDFAIGEKEDEIFVDDGYWRYTQNSSKIIECPNNDACLGGYHPENEYPVKGASGYHGILCTQGDIVNGTKYQPLSDFQCSKCPNATFNALRVIAVSYTHLPKTPKPQNPKRSKSIDKYIMEERCRRMTPEKSFVRIFPDLFFPNKLNISWKTNSDYTNLREEFGIFV